MNQILVSRSIIGLLLVTLACSGSQNVSNQSGVESFDITQLGPPPSDAVGSVGNEYVLYSELKDNFVSGSVEKEYTAEDLQDFLPIYMDYRGKLLDARTAGYYENDQITEEYQLYSKQAAYAYWMDREIRPTKFQEFKDRFDFEVKSKHILIAVDQNASAEDTLEAYTRILEARDRLIAGASIEELDDEYSTKRNGRSMGGDLPWFSVGTTVAEFENALYSLDIGEISMPVRTQFGYHIIYLEDKRERVPSRQVYHIFVRRDSDPTKLERAYEDLSNGKEWAVAVSDYSEDTPSIQSEGYIGWINYGSRYDGAFIDSVMQSDPSLPFTEPIQTVYGTHIFKVDSVQTFQNEEARDEYIMGILEDSDSFQESNGFVVEYLLQKYVAKSYSENALKLQEYIQSLDTTSYADIEMSSSLASLPAFSMGTLQYSLTDFLDYLKSTQSNRNSTFYSADWFESFIEAKVDENLTSITLEEFPEFEDQTKSYQHGLVVYQINEDSVWSTATIDTTVLMDTYQNNLDTYRFDKRFYYYMISSSRDTSLDRAIEFVNEGNSPDSLISNGFRVGVTSDSTGAFQGEPFTLLQEMEAGSLSERFDYSGRKAHFYLVEVLPERTMTFDEAFNRLASEYQPIREEKWLNRIREEYNIQTFPDVVRAQFEIENSLE